ncbi:MAG: hypothetical protein R6T78_03220 [Dehalococcoidales bacterium]
MVEDYNVVITPAEADGGGLGTPAIVAIILGSVGVGLAIFFARRRTV